MNGQLTFAGGTSIAAPIIAGMVALLNDARLAAGKPPMGLVAPFFYSAYEQDPSTFLDIARGSNPGCGSHGFAALEGWDPATGLGSPRFDKIMELAMRVA